MSMFGSIMSKIFGHPAAAPAVAQANAEPPPVPTDTTVQQPVAGTPTSPAATTSPAAPAEPVDVGAVLATMSEQHGGGLNYKTSIVDLMKLLGLDSSLEARKTLAGELHYTGSTEDSAAMNVWLHKEVMTKLEQNGGVVPADLKGA